MKFRFTLPNFRNRTFRYHHLPRGKNCREYQQRLFDVPPIFPGEPRSQEHDPRENKLNKIQDHPIFKNPP